MARRAGPDVPSASGPHLRPLLDDDWPAALSVWTAAWCALLPEIDFVARQPWFTAHCATARAAGARCIGAFLPEGALAGFMMVDPVTGLLDQLVVRPEQQGHGIATALMAEARLLSPAGLRLQVNQMNHRAIAFYEREGFRRAGEGRNATSGLATWHYAWQPAMV
jgi:putative acetyltransferase